MINKVVIIPTGDEVLKGLVIDTNSPMIMETILMAYPKCIIKRTTPIQDVEDKISDSIKKYAKDNNDLIIIIGGSGGGHRYVKTLAKDFTHSAMISILDQYTSREIYGKNGHLWSKIVCGKIDNSLVVNLPGPYREAKSGIEKLVESLKNDVKDLNAICGNIAESVKNEYPLGGDIK